MQEPAAADAAAADEAAQSGAELGAERKEKEQHITDALVQLEGRYAELEEHVGNQQKKLQNVLDVNRALRRAIATKQRSIKELESKTADLMVRLKAKEVEAKGRVEKLANVQQVSMQAQQVHKENQARLSRTVRNAEDEVVNLNKDNVLFAEEHVDLNHVLADQETRLADLDRRIESSASRLAALCDALTEESSTGLDYHNLPKLPLAKLLRGWREDEEERQRLGKQPTHRGD
jgi:chromosome segregation ATPase